MYRLKQSSDAAALADVFAEDLLREIPQDPLASTEVIVPNRDTARWLSLRLAERNGIAANIDYRLPSEWAWKRIRERHPALPSLLPSDPGPMTWQLYAVLSRAALPDQLEPLSSWIDKQSGDRGLGIWTLARMIASVFDQYQVYRPEMLLAWERGSSGEGDEAWQQALWKILVYEWNLLENKELRNHRGRIFLQFAEYVKDGDAGGTTPVILFNPGLLAPPISRLLMEYSQFRETIHYRVSSSPVNGLPGDGVEWKNPLLSSLIGEQQEQLRGLAHFSEGRSELVEVRTIPGCKPAGHNLARIQESIIENRPLPELDRPDDSIEIRSCHSPLREVEVLQQYLLKLFSDREDLAPDDVLIVTPDLTAYRPYIEAVFGTAEEGLPRIPFHLPGSSRAADRSLATAFMHLLRIPGSRFRKEDLFGFLGHTAILDSFGFSQTDLSRLRRWFDENRVVWGLNDDHRAEFDQPKGSRQTWEQAMNRGWLGQMIADHPGFFLDGQLLFPGVTSGEEKELWAGFQYLLRLLGRVKRSTSAQRTAGEWGVELTEWVELFLPDSAVYEEGVLSLKSRIREFVLEVKTGLGREREGRKIPFSLVQRSFVELAERGSVGSSLFTEGVVVHSMVPVRSLPFRVIALLGLNEGVFPRKPVRPEFDLMALEGRPGERDHRREDGNLFLESLLAAGQVHYTSYVGRSQKDDEPMPPSVILDEWIGHVAGALGIKTEDLVRRHSLNGFSANAFARTGVPCYSSGYFSVAAGMAEKGKSAGIEIDTPLPPPDEFTEGVLSLQEFERFFRDPSGAFFRRRLGIRLRDLTGREESEFRLEGLDRHLLFQQLFGWVVEGREDEEMVELLLASGRLPEGWPGMRSIREMLHSARSAEAGMRSLGHVPAMTPQEVDLELAGVQLRGEVVSYSSSSMLDIHPTKESGRRFLSSWIRHLACCCASGDAGEWAFSTDLLFDFKTGTGSWSRFGYEPRARERLEDLLELFKVGMCSPLVLYIDTAYVYVDSLKKGPEQAMSDALKRWEGGYLQQAERDNRFLELFLGPEAEADPDRIREVANRMYEPAFDKLERL